MGKTYIKPPYFPRSESSRLKWNARLAKEVERTIREGTFSQPEQQFFPLDLNNRSNNGLPLPSTAFRLQEPVISPLKELTLEEIQEGAQDIRSRTKTRKPHLYVDYKKLVLKSLKKNKPEQAQASEERQTAFQHYPRLPKLCDEESKKHYPTLFVRALNLARLLYLKDHRNWSWESIAFRLHSSPEQVRGYYLPARILHCLYTRLTTLEKHIQ
jgi:hypothetical protein